MKKPEELPNYVEIRFGAIPVIDEIVGCRRITIDDIVDL